jgi:hypothetical protein
MDNLLKLSDYAKLIGKTPQAVRKAIGDGRIKKGVTQGKRGYLIDAAVANREWNSNTDESQQRTAEVIRQGKASAAGMEQLPNAPSYSKARAIGEVYKSKLLELEFKEKAGQLINADEATAAQFKITRIFRDAVQNIPVRVVSELAAIVGELTPDKRHEMMLVMQREIDRSLTQLADSDGIG